MSSPSSSSENGLPSRASTPDQEDVEAYQQLMNTLFPSSTLPPPPQVDTIKVGKVDVVNDEDDNEIMDNGVKRPMTKAEKQNAKKKRRKERDRILREQMEMEAKAKAKAVAQLETNGSKSADQDTTIPFRLFSSCPIGNVSLIPEIEEYTFPPNPRFQAISPDELIRINRIAAEAAIDHGYFDTPTSSQVVALGSSSTTTTYNVDAPQELVDLPEMLIGELPRYKTVISTVGSQSKDTPSRSKPRLIETVQLIPPSLKSSTANISKTRRGKRKKSSSNVQARFWAPSVGIGGKGRGYAWGYRDSMEGRRDKGGWEGYIRSKDR